MPPLEKVRSAGQRSAEEHDQRGAMQAGSRVAATSFDTVQERLWRGHAECKDRNVGDVWALRHVQLLKGLQRARLLVQDAEGAVRDVFARRDVEHLQGRACDQNLAERPVT